MMWTHDKPYYIACSNCKTKLTQTDVYCRFCGRKLDRSCLK